MKNQARYFELYNNQLILVRVNIFYAV